LIVSITFPLLALGIPEPGEGESPSPNGF